MKKAAVLLIAVLLAIPATSSAFDGLRKGFVLGGGLGISPTSRWSFDLGQLDPSNNGSVDETKVAFAAHMVIGYAWDEANMLVYEGNVTTYRSQFFSLGGFLPDETIGQGFNGAAWYHYFGPMGMSFFTAAGIGFYVFDVQNFKSNDPGVGYLVGAGYEFARHVQVGGYFSGGQTKSAGKTFGHLHASVMVSAVAF